MAHKGHIALIVLLLLAFDSTKTFSDFQKVSEFVIRDASSGEVFFTGEEFRRGASGKIEVHRRWFDNEKDTAYIEKFLYNPTNFKIDWVRSENRVTKESEYVRRSGGRYTVKTTDTRGRVREKTINTNGNQRVYHPVVLASFAIANFNKILEENLNFDLIAPDRGRTFGFYFDKRKEVTINSQRLSKIVMEGRNAVVRALAPDIFFYFKTENGKPVLKLYRGILLMPIDGERGRRIEIEYKSP